MVKFKTQSTSHNLYMTTLIGPRTKGWSQKEKLILSFQQMAFVSKSKGLTLNHREMHVTASSVKSLECYIMTNTEITNDKLTEISD